MSVDELMEELGSLSDIRFAGYEVRDKISFAW